MNQIMNVTAIGTKAAKQMAPHKLAASRGAHVARSSASRGNLDGKSFRVPRGERTSSASAGKHEAHTLQDARIIRGGSSGNGNHGNSDGSRNQIPRDKRHQPTPRNGRHSGSGNGKRKALIALLLAALLLAGFGAWKFMNLSPEEATGGAFYDQSASQIQEAVDHEVQDGYFNMSINTSVPVFDDNSAAIGIRNIESNQYDCIVTVALEDGTEVYKSGGLAPGTELDMVTLTQDLEPGDYEATAVFEIYEQDEGHTVAGQTASKLTLHVL